ncbi:MAG: hypothetical protein R2771_02400 [Saprospiraceae bacterium]
MLKQHPQKLYDFYFNPAAPGIPGVGFSATELAEKVSLFMREYEGNLSNSFDSELFENGSSGNTYNPEIKRVFSGSSGNFNNSVSCQNAKMLEAEFSYNSSDYRITFSLNRCPKLGVEVSLLEPTYQIGCNCANNYVAVSELESTLGFYDLVYNIILDNVTLLDLNCSPPEKCKNKLLTEYAFVTMTRMREMIFNVVLNNTILTTEIISLPFSIMELSGAQGVKLLFRGTILATEVESVAIAIVGDGDFNKGCKMILERNLAFK